jgi:iron complex outermembrane receptor protein
MVVLRKFLLGLLVLMFTAMAASAQTTSLTGSVVDAFGEVIVDAAVTLVSPAGRTQTTRTNAEGRYSFGGVTPAEYTLVVDAPGFAQWSQKVNVGPGTQPLAIALRVAGLSESVSVIGTAPATLTRPTLTATRLGLTPIETPASIQIISGDVIRERGDQSVIEAKSRAVGVTHQGDPGNGGNAVAARGFGGVGSVMQLFDGDQLHVGAGTVTFPFDPWTVERIEVLGGPASVLYGNGAIGGVINVVPRKPNPFSRENTVRVAAGSFNTWRGAFDSAGPIGDRASYRFDVSSNLSDGWVRDNESRSTAVSGSVRHEISPTLVLTLSEDFGHQRPGTYFGTPTVDGEIDEDLREVNYNVEDADIWYRDNWTQAKLEWQPRPNVRVRTGLHLLATNRHWKNVESYTVNPADDTVEREGYLEIFHKQRQYGDRTDAVFTNMVAGRSNTLSVGMDYNFISFQHTNNSPYQGSSVTDLENASPGLFINVAGTVPKYRTRTHQMAFFAEDRFAVTPQVSLVAGVRVDRYDVERRDLVGGGVAERVYTPGSWRGGVVYMPSPGVSFYGQYATATDTIGNVISNSPSNLLFDPTTGRQVEAGVKHTFLEQRAEWTVAGYHIVKNKLLAPIPSNPAEVQQIGEQSSRGVEVTAAVNLPAGLRVEGNLAVLDARFDDFAESIGGVLVSRNGLTPPSIPERSANLWITWNAPGQWQVRGGWRHVGRRFWDNTNTTLAPGYDVVDLGLRKQLTRTVGLDARLFNVGDELYATDFYFNEYAPQWMLGTPRSAEVALTVGF